MDLGAFVNIENLEHVMKENGIEVPRLRGLRLMEAEEKIPQEEYESQINYIWLNACEDACRSKFIMNANWIECSIQTDKIVNKYMIKDHFEPIDVRWDKVHGFRRKIFKYELRKAKKKVKLQYDIFNKYAGMPNILYIHARIGGNNWEYYNGDKLKKEPWFIEKVDDAFDDTYCDIYARIK